MAGETAKGGEEMTRRLHRDYYVHKEGPKVVYVVLM
jgi:hypothetical protein